MWRLLLLGGSHLWADGAAADESARSCAGLRQERRPEDAEVTDGGDGAVAPRARWLWLLRAAEVTLAAMIVIAGWSHGLLTIEGGSMMPVLHPGDVVLYKRVAVSLARGDLAVFEHGGSLVIHRVAGLERDGSVRTRGDANESIDLDPVAEEAIKGEVVAVIPLGRALVRVTGGGS